MSATRDFLSGLAALVDEAEIGVFDTARTWTAADAGWSVALGPRLPEDPPKLIVLSAYTPAPDDPKMTDSLLAVQFRLRGDEDPGSVQDVNDALFDRFHGMHDTTVGGVPLVLLWRQSSLPGPADDNGRQQYTSNFYARVTLTSLYRTD